MWDAFARIIIYLLDKISLINIFFLMLIYILVWLALPYERVVDYLFPRELPIEAYYCVLFICAASIYLLGKAIVNLGRYCYFYVKRRKAFRLWEKIYETLSTRDRDIIFTLISQDPIPFELDRQEVTHLVFKGIIERDCLYCRGDFYFLTSSFREFIFTKLNIGKAT